jgi:histone deacetylase 1/2
MSTQKDGSIEMKQPFLIQRIQDALGDSIKDANIKKTPALAKEVLHKDENGPDRKQSWAYRSVIGMLGYLNSISRPDCLYSTHQCARFSANPKLMHERALKRIVRYLKGTKDKGIILKPQSDKGIECYVDADFAGGYIKEASHEPTSVMSRTGYVIYYMGCPILWVSVLVYILYDSCCNIT